ncbi:phosphoglycolate phosphatase, bacterial [Pseudoalteromonas sp. A25]|uniref:HAD family hydrolase n=1 Tax=Pseudoalteromonas sp. A25 TaxID=116092 RepID=UPI00126124BE|nr:HAD-IA family hydrolase [Pseudoalteromonas sp. A25]BBN81715.1 phosphoglycolate phosphatase, bacterial [Pseudoalteromonas sp. A25]
MIEAVIFDLDGTLLDTCDDLGAALNYTLKLHNKPCVPKDIYSPAISNGVQALLEVGFQEELVNYELATLKQTLLDHYAQNIAVHSRCFKGIKTLLEEIERKGIKVGIMTNKPTFLTLPLLECIDELKSIKVVVCGDTLDEAKPSPKPLLHAAKQLGVQPSACFYVGDAARDIEAAKAANMLSVTALWGYVPSKAVAQSWQADLNLTKPESLISHI